MFKYKRNFILQGNHSYVKPGIGLILSFFPMSLSASAGQMWLNYFIITPKGLKEISFYRGNHSYVKPGIGLILSFFPMSLSATAGQVWLDYFIITPKGLI